MEYESKNKTDEELARQARAGSLSAFDELLGRHGDRIYAFLVGKTGNTEDAKDLTQTVFIKAYKNMSKYDDKYKFTTWIFCIARREFASFYRSRRPASCEIEEDSVIVHDNPSSAMEAGEHRDDIWNAARNLLPESQFTALWMHYREDMSVKDTARIMCCKTGNVKVLLHRARKKLLDDLPANGFESLGGS